MKNTLIQLFAFFLVALVVCGLGAAVVVLVTGSLQEGISAFLGYVIGSFIIVFILIPIMEKFR